MDALTNFWKSHWLNLFKVSKTKPVMRTNFTPTHPAKMSLQTLAQVCSRLHTERTAHRENAAFFNTLFNRRVPKEVEAKLQYTELQRFYQLQAEYHITRVLRIDAEIMRLDGFANSDLFPDAPAWDENNGI